MTGGKITEINRLDIIKSRLMKILNSTKNIDNKILEKT